MGDDALAVLFGEITTDRIASAFAEAGFPANAAGTSLMGAGWVLVTDREGRARQAFVCPDTSDHADVYAGTRTTVTLGAYGAAPELVRALAESFGGYHRPRPDAPFAREAGRGGAPPTPAETLLLALRELVPGETALTLLRAMEADPGAAGALREAIEAYDGARPPSPSP